MYIRFIPFKFPSKSKAENFISIISTPLWQEKFEKKTTSKEQIIISNREGKLVGMGIYKSQEGFQKSSKMLQTMLVNLVKSFDGILYDEDVVFHRKRRK